MFMYREAQRSPHASGFSRENYIELLEAKVSVHDINELIGKFVADANSILDVARQAAQENDVTLLRSQLHKLKGSAAAMHVDGLLALIDGYQQLDDYKLQLSIANDADDIKRAVLAAAGEVRDFLKENSSVALTSEVSRN
jgi:HPt (histidine-containing phosphotransfer) domain-containing protein